MEIGQCWSRWAQNWPKSAGRGRSRSNGGRTQPKVGRIRSKLSRRATSGQGTATCARHPDLTTWGSHRLRPDSCRHPNRWYRRQSRQRERGPLRRSSETLGTCSLPQSNRVRHPCSRIVRADASTSPTTRRFDASAKRVKCVRPSRVSGRKRKRSWEAANIQSGRVGSKRCEVDLEALAPKGSFLMGAGQAGASTMAGG